jgi:hypothetical protein
VLSRAEMMNTARDFMSVRQVPLHPHLSQRSPV